MKFAFMILVILAQGVSAAETKLVPFEVQKHMGMRDSIIECSEAGDAVFTQILWGSDVEEVFKFFAREKNLPQTDFNKNIGPFKSYREYSLAIEAHKKSYIQRLRDANFSPLSLLKKSPNGTIDFRQDPNDFLIKAKESFHSAMLKIATEDGWNSMAVEVEINVQKKSPFCGRAI